ncbi:hypothetical protein P8452_51533 [Trifolium repens]|nr:hypothetical protein P8452_51533 [Trifolium repens]
MRGGGVRLTEYEDFKGDGFVRRLNQEAISYFFTNFPDDVLVVDLWKLFAKFGRVGEVYIPSKKDKWGRRFGFVKYLDVGNVEKLTLKLGEVWSGSFKLRINLSRFERKKKSSSQELHPNSIRGEGKSFREIVAGGHGSRGKEKEQTVEGSKKVTKGSTSLSEPLVLDPDVEFLFTLENSMVGRISKGKSIKQIQFNLCMEGYKNIRAASLGEGWAMIFSESGGDVGLALNNKVWWEGFLEELRPWSPIMASSKREIWVRIYGVPLQLWYEQAFRSILQRYGEVVGLDAETSSRARFDVARVKILVPVLGVIDFTQEIVTQGLKFVIRGLEERGGPLEFVHNSREEDQLRWSTVASSCDSGERGVDGTGAASVEGGGDFCDTESDGSDQSQEKEEQVVQRKLEDKENLEKVNQNSFSKTAVERATSSKDHADKLKSGAVSCGETNEVEILCGVSHSSQVGGDKDKEGVQGVNMVGQPGVSLFVPVDGLLTNGPSYMGPTPNPDSSLVRVPVGSGDVEERVLVQVPVGQAEGKLVIDKFDSMVKEARGKTQRNQPLNFTLADSNLSSSSPSSLTQPDMASSIRPSSVRNRKPLSRIPFPNLVGHKCLRLLEVVNRVGACSMRKRNGIEEGRQKATSEGEQREDSVDFEEERDNSSVANLLPHQFSPENVPEAEVSEVPNSGVNHIFGDDDLVDVDGFTLNRQGPRAKRLEAEEILEIQNALGLNFVEDKETVLNQLVDLEDRDREKMIVREEVNGSQ